MIGRLICGFTTIIVGTALLPQVASAVRERSSVIEFKEEKPQRQTYEDYVQERLRVERMLK